MTLLDLVMIEIPPSNLSRAIRDNWGSARIAVNKVRSYIHLRQKRAHKARLDTPDNSIDAGRFGRWQAEALMSAPQSSGRASAERMLAPMLILYKP
jgi:hypothetical protein